MKKVVARRSKDKNRTASQRQAERYADVDTDRSYGSQTIRWWTAETGIEASGRLFQWTERLRQRWSIDGVMDLIHEAIYLDEPLGLGFDGQIGVSGYGGIRYPRAAPASLNHVMSLVDTATARLCKRRPMPVISADDASYSEKRFAKQVSRVLRRKMGGPDVERMSPWLVRDMLIRGTSVGLASRNAGDVEMLRAPIYEFVYDPREAYYGPPRSLARIRPINREVLIAMFPDKRDEIWKAPVFNRADPWMMYVYGGPTFADHVEVAEAWHLPSGGDVEDGQYIMAIRGHTLRRRGRPVPRYQHALGYWSAPVRGFRGRGLVQQLAGMQAKINDLVRDAQEALFHGSQLKVFMARGSGVVKSHLRARHPAVIEYDGAVPQYVAPNPVSEQAIAMINMLEDRMKTISGLNDMSVAGKNQLGANASGRALDTMDDLQSNRFAHVELAYGEMRCDMARSTIDEARLMYEEATTGRIPGDDMGWETGNPVEKSELAEWIRENDWSKCEIDQGSFTLTLEPINFVPETRGGKLEAAAELSKNGLIPDPTMTAALFDEPDMARMNRPILGPIRNIERMIDDLIETKKPIEDCLPTPYTNPALFVLMAKGEIEFAQAERAPDEVIQRLDRAIKYVKDLADAAAASPSLPGMQSAQMGPSPNAATLQPGMGGPPPAPAGPPGMPPPMPGGPMPS